MKLEEEVKTKTISNFIDDLFVHVMAAPGMYGGTPIALEMFLLGVLAVYTGLCFTEPVRTQAYDVFRRRHCPQIPGPMLISTWVTDKENGDPQLRKPTDLPADKLAHLAGIRIVEHYLAYKQFLDTYEP